MENNNIKGNQQQVTPRKNGFSPAGKALGIVSLCLFWIPFLDLAISIPGIVMSNVGLKMAQNEQQHASAKTGKVCSVLATILNILCFLVLVILIPILAANGKI